MDRWSGENNTIMNNILKCGTFADRMSIEYNRNAYKEMQGAYCAKRDILKRHMNREK